MKEKEENKPENVQSETPQVSSESVKQNDEGTTTDFEAKYNEVADKYTRLFAEYDNYRKRTSREKIEWIKAAGEEVILNVLPIIDDMERAIAHNKSVTDIEVLKEGLTLIHQKFKNILSAKGVEGLETKGQPFNPDIHEAITNMAVEAEDMKGKVVEEIEKGYTLNGKVIRHAKVVVGN